MQVPFCHPVVPINPPQEMWLSTLGALATKYWCCRSVTPLHCEKNAGGQIVVSKSSDEPEQGLSIPAKIAISLSLIGAIVLAIVLIFYHFLNNFVWAQERQPETLVDRVSTELPERQSVVPAPQTTSENEQKKVSSFPKIVSQSPAPQFAEGKYRFNPFELPPDGDLKPPTDEEQKRHDEIIEVRLSSRLANYEKEYSVIGRSNYRQQSHTKLEVVEKEEEVKVAKEEEGSHVEVGLQQSQETSVLSGESPIRVQHKLSFSVVEPTNLLGLFEIEAVGKKKSESPFGINYFIVLDKNSAIINDGESLIAMIEWLKKYILPKLRSIDTLSIYGMNHLIISRRKAKNVLQAIFPIKIGEKNYPIAEFFNLALEQFSKGKYDFLEKPTTDQEIIANQFLHKSHIDGNPANAFEGILRVVGQNKNPFQSNVVLFFSNISPYNVMAWGNSYGPPRFNKIYQQFAEEYPQVSKNTLIFPILLGNKTAIGWRTQRAKLSVVTKVVPGALSTALTGRVNHYRLFLQEIQAGRAAQNIKAIETIFERFNPTDLEDFLNFVRQQATNWKKTVAEDSQKLKETFHPNTMSESLMSEFVNTRQLILENVLVEMREVEAAVKAQSMSAERRALATATVICDNVKKSEEINQSRVEALQNAVAEMEAEDDRASQAVVEAIDRIIPGNVVEFTKMVMRIPKGMSLKGLWLPEGCRYETTSEDGLEVVKIAFVPLGIGAESREKFLFQIKQVDGQQQVSPVLQIELEADDRTMKRRILSQTVHCDLNAEIDRQLKTGTPTPVSVQRASRYVFVQGIMQAAWEVYSTTHEAELKELKAQYKATYDKKKDKGDPEILKQMNAIYVSRAEAARKIIEAALSQMDVRDLVPVAILNRLSNLFEYSRNQEGVIFDTLMICKRLCQKMHFEQDPSVKFAMAAAEQLDGMGLFKVCSHSLVKAEFDKMVASNPDAKFFLLFRSSADAVNALSFDFMVYNQFHKKFKIYHSSVVFDREGGMVISREGYEIGFNRSFQNLQNLLAAINERIQMLLNREDCLLFSDTFDDA